MTKILVDSNILIYSLQKKEGKKHDLSAEFINELIDSSNLTLSIQNLIEFSRVMSEKVFPSVDNDLIRQYVAEFSASASIIYYNNHTVMDALLISKQYEIHFFDALVVATMQENGVETIATENEKDFKKLPWLTVINPFKEK